MTKVEEEILPCGILKDEASAVHFELKSLVALVAGAANALCAKPASEMMVFDRIVKECTRL